MTQLSGTAKVVVAGVAFDAGTSDLVVAATAPSPISAPTTSVAVNLNTAGTTTLTTFLSALPTGTLVAGALKPGRVAGALQFPSDMVASLKSVGVAAPLLLPYSGFAFVGK